MPASACIHPSLFDLPVVAPEYLDARRSSGVSRGLRASLVLALGLLSATMLHRSFLRPEAPLLSATQRQRMLARPVLEPAPSLEFSPLVVPPTATGAVPIEAPKPVEVASVPDKKHLEQSKPAVLDQQPAAPSPRTEVQRVAPGVPKHTAGFPAAAPARPVNAAAQTIPPGTPPAARTGGPSASSPSTAPLPSRGAQVLDRMQLQ